MILAGQALYMAAAEISEYAYGESMLPLGHWASDGERGGAARTGFMECCYARGAVHHLPG